MKPIYLFVTIAILSSLSLAAQNITDTIMSKQLNEVVVKASRRLERGDTLSILPSANQRKFSMSGFELFRNMMLPGLRVNTITGELSMSNGESVVVQIDGRQVDRQNILALRPKEVAKVEFIQNPGSEYGYDSSIGAVINVIMKQRTDGYAAAVLLNNAVTTANGQNFTFGKYTKNNSEYTLSLNSDYTSLSRRRVDNLNTYTFEDHPKTIAFEGMNTRLKYTENTLQAGYNHYIPKKHIFDVSFKGVFYYSPDRAYAQKVAEEGEAPYFQMSRPYEKYLSPQLNFFYKRFIGKSSTLTANLVGRYLHTDYHYNVFESPTNRFDYDNPTYRYGTVSNRQSYIGEIKYSNKFNRKFTLSVGARGSYSYTSNDYTLNESSIDRLHDTNVYAYASASGYFGKLYYLAGVGMSGRMINQNHNTYDKWMFRPELQFSYRAKGWRFNLRGIMLQNSPSLSEMATTEVRTNRYELRKGNPDLEDWWKYRMSLKISKKILFFNIQNTLSYTNAHNPVMSFVERITDREGDMLFMTSFKNQKRMSVLTDNFVLDFGLGDNLSVSGGINYNQYRSRGISYSHNLDSWQFSFAADWYSGNLNAGINIRSREKTLSGESYSYTGAYNNMYINYIIGNRWRFGIIAQYLLCKNGPTFKDELKSYYMTKHETIVVPAQKNMIMVTVAWNFSAGKQRKEAKIDMHNSDVNTGIFK